MLSFVRFAASVMWFKSLLSKLATVRQKLDTPPLRVYHRYTVIDSGFSHTTTTYGYVAWRRWGSYHILPPRDTFHLKSYLRCLLLDPQRLGCLILIHVMNHVLRILSTCLQLKIFFSWTICRECNSFPQTAKRIDVSCPFTALRGISILLAASVRKLRWSTHGFYRGTLLLLIFIPRASVW